MNNPLIKILKDLHTSNEGALLNNPNKAGEDEQIRFISNIIKKISPKFILETGTDKGLFTLFILETIGDSFITTFDVMDFSEKAISILNEKYGNRVHFIKGDTNVTFSNFNSEHPIDLAFIDGDHSYNGCLSDLNNCLRLNIHNILIDDYLLLDTVTKAVNIFCGTNNYYVYDRTANYDDRGMIWIRNEK